MQREDRFRRTAGLRVTGARTACEALLCALALQLPSSICADAQVPGRRTYCNPLDIDYKYCLEERERGISYRSGADPVIAPFRGAYYLFVTNAGGWWRSGDLRDWTFVTPSTWPTDDICAPAVEVVRDTLYLFPSTFERRPIYFTTTPWDGCLRYFNPLLPQMPGASGPWDPDIFHDDATDRWYMYFGSSNFYPIYGIELDHARGLTYIGRATPLLSLHPDVHGWERFGQDHTDTIHPYIEGSWMTRHGGRYYLQYAAPGTEYNVYANGTYVGPGPLGPFTYAPNNPVSYRPGGFMVGAGHGNTFRDRFGNYWNTGTPWVAVNYNFERRVAMFPAAFDGDGLMYSDTRFGDFPHFVPARRWRKTGDLFAGWMLLSYRKKCCASSTLGAFVPDNAADENPRTFWVARRNAPGEWLSIDLGAEDSVFAVQVNFTDYKSNIYARDSTVYTRFRVLTSRDGAAWSVAADLGGETRDRPNAYLELPAPVRARYVRYEHMHVAAAHLAISDLRVFGRGAGKLPAVPLRVRARRLEDPRSAVVSWEPVPGAVGYNILWGISPGKLYETYQVFADRPGPLEIRALSAGQGYFVAMESFNERGVSRLSPAVRVR